VATRQFSASGPEVGRVLLQAGLWAVTGKLFPLDSAALPGENVEGFREALVKRAVREKMMPMLDVFSSSHDLGLGDLPSQLSEVFRIVSHEQYRHLKPLLGELSGCGIPALLIKGGDLDLAIYRKKFPRVMGDLDVLVRPPDVAAVVDAFKRHGYVQGVLDKNLAKIVPFTAAERAQAEDGSIELAEFSKLISVPALSPYADLIGQYLPGWRMMPLGGSFYVALIVDVHLHLSLDFDIQDVWSNLRTISFPEIGQCLAQGFADLAWYLAVRLYHELHLSNAPVMRTFLDVLMTVLRAHQSFDWPRISSIADKYRLHPALYYTFWHINEVLPDVVPAALLAHLCPSRIGSERAHDWGDFIPRMLGIVQVAPIFGKGLFSSDLQAG
jgi:Uncharacterised nucleotidyltransferase